MGQFLSTVLQALAAQSLMLSIPCVLGATFVSAIVINVLWQLLIPQDPTLPPQVFYFIPIIGSAIQYGHDPINFFFDCRKKYGDVFTFVLLGRRMTVALGPKGGNFVLGGKLSQVSAAEAYTHLTTPIFGEGVVFDAPNHVFMEQKKFIKAGLTTANLRAYVPMIADETTHFLNNELPEARRVRNSGGGWGSFHVLEALSGLTILTAARTLQGKEVRAGLDKTFAEYYKDLDGGFTPLNFVFPNLPLPNYWRRDRAHKKMSDFYVNIIESRKRNAESSDEHDMIAALSAQEYKNGNILGDREIAHLMIALLMGGQHTSASTGAWILLHLADRPDIVQQMLEEQKEVFGGADGSLRPLNYDDLQRLPVLNSVIRETLRVHPPLHSIMRKCIDDIVVPTTLAAPNSKRSNPGAYVVPKGYYLLASPAIAQVDPAVWQNANAWDPARWSDPLGTAAQAEALYVGEHGEKVDYGFGMISKGTESPYQPFGAGRHRCIGEKFAYLQIGTVISTIIRTIEMKLEREGGVPKHNYHTMIVQPEEPCIIRFRYRK